MCRTQTQRDQNAVWINLLLACWALHKHFGFGEQRLKKFLVCFGYATKELANIKYGKAQNQTWRDELMYWADSMGLNEAVNGDSHQNRKD